MKKHLKVYISILIFLLIFSSISFGSSYSRRITAWFNNIKISIDGTELQGTGEPFIYKDVVYAPVQDILDALYINSNYIEDLGVLEITSNHHLLENLSNDNLNITYRDWISVPHEKGIRANALEREVANLKEELKDLEEELDYYAYRFGTRYRNNPYYTINSLSEMRRYINNHFRQIAGTNVSITLRSSRNNRYTLSVRSTNLTNPLSEIPERFIEYWVEDVLDAIQNCYDEDATIEGSVRQLVRGSGYEDITTFEVVNNYLVFDHK